jgi:hypothetical protein
VPDIGEVDIIALALIVLLVIAELCHRKLPEDQRTTMRERLPRGERRLLKDAMATWDSAVEPM